MKFTTDNGYGRILAWVFLQPRSALNDPTSESRFIRTVPGRGYSFVGEVERYPATPARTCGMALLPAHNPGWPRLWLTQAMALGFAAAAIAIVALWSASADPGPSAQANPGQLAPLGVSTIPRPEIRIPNSIAVLPLVLLRPDHDALFAVGLHDEMISQLTAIPVLNVVGRRSVVALQENGYTTLDIARILRVESILSGTLRLAGSRASVCNCSM